MKLVAIVVKKAAGIFENYVKTSFIRIKKDFKESSKHNNGMIFRHSTNKTSVTMNYKLVHGECSLNPRIDVAVH